MALTLKTTDIHTSLLGAFFLKPLPTEALTQSIKDLSVITPLTVVLHEDRYQLIDGFQRLTIAQELGIEEIPVTCLENTALTQCLKLRLSDLRYSVLPAIQIAFHVKAISLLGLSKEDLMSLLVYYDIHPTPQRLHQLKQVLSIPEALISYCKGKHIPLKHLTRLSELSPELKDLFLKLVSDLQLSATVGFECVDSFVDLSKRNNTNIAGLLSHPEIADILASTSPSHERVKRLRETLYNLKHPTLNEKLAEIHALLSTCPELKGASWDKTLENKGLNLTVSIRNDADIEQAIETLQDKTVVKTISKVLQAF